MDRKRAALFLLACRDHHRLTAAPPAGRVVVAATVRPANFRTRIVLETCPYDICALCSRINKLRLHLCDALGQATAAHFDQ